MNRAAQVSRILKVLHRAAAAVHKPIAFMEVCGTHTMAAFRSGLHSLLPDNLRLLSGPGCPVCVTAQADIDLLVQVAALPDITVCTYGDMIRVPGRTGSLEKARSTGADVRVIYSTLDAVNLAQANPQRQVVLAAVGFETTAPATAAAILEAKRRDLRNFSVLASHKRVIPAMTALLESGQVRVDGFLCPGHVSAVIGAEVYRPIVRQYHMPCVISGFEEIHMAAALATLTQQVCDGRAELVNDYGEAVSPGGNTVALAVMDQVFTTTDARWRALGTLPRSGLSLRPAYQFFDAMHRFGLEAGEDREIPGCLCGKVILGAATPFDCKLFARACTPINPIGPCMVSSEGTCQAYFKYARAGISGRFSGSYVGSETPAKEGQPSYA